MVKKLWAYIKKNKLQDTKNKRNINADETLKVIFRKNTVNMFEMTKLVSKHLAKASGTRKPRFRAARVARRVISNLWSCGHNYSLSRLRAGSSRDGELVSAA